MVSERIRKLSINAEALLEKKEYRIKSKVQTYDLRDCEEYYGIMALESLLKQYALGMKELDLDTIRRQSTKRYKLGSSFKMRSATSELQPVDSDGDGGSLQTSFADSDIEDQRLVR